MLSFQTLQIQHICDASLTLESEIQICMFSHDKIALSRSYTLGDMKGTFISESGIEQILKRRKIVIPQSNTFDHGSTRKPLLIVVTAFHCQKPLRGMPTTLPVNQSLEEMITSRRNIELKT